ncbi:hypothetical protein H5410_016655 [Solanum commersonii]|uniref:Uncharacterized protein n=1 Tax=Solanum commersonii TaxID=4109 RepID=A0A9J5ZYA2_SOLCO|nr:hypothetical protein H5410_016655 [Solanum commersonii]
MCSFCVKYDILIPNFDEFYVNFGRSRRKVLSILFHITINSMIVLMRLEHLLIGVACLNPVDSFSSFDIKNILRMAELYPR